MLLLYIATGAFIIGGGIILVSNFATQKSSKKWY